MDGFTGFKSATAEELPDAVAVMDPFHVVRLAGDALDQCRGDGSVWPTASVIPAGVPHELGQDSRLKLASWDK